MLTHKPSKDLHFGSFIAGASYIIYDGWIGRIYGDGYVITIISSPPQDLRLQLVLAAYLAVCALAAVGLRPTQPPLLMGLGLVAVPFVPMSNLLFLVGTTIGERLLYPLTVGAAFLAAALGAQCRGGKALAIPLLAVYVVNSNIRMTHWASPAVLFMKESPQRRLRKTCENHAKWHGTPLNMVENALKSGAVARTPSIGTAL